MRKKTINTLTDLMNKYGSDKGKERHNYTLVYEKIFSKFKKKQINLFELGLGTNYTDIPSSMGPDGKPGASLRGWRDYFENSNIYGADIDKRILFDEERIKTYFVDQTDSKKIEELWSNQDLKDIDFDIIVDDGLHEIYANICFLKNSFYKLKIDGIYIIEDIRTNEVQSIEQELNLLKDSMKFTYEVQVLDHEFNALDNVIAIIQKTSL